MHIIRHDNLPRHDYLELYPLADLHFEDHLHDTKQSQRWQKEVMAQDNRYVILNGDLLNIALRNSLGDLYKERYEPEEAIDKLVEFLSPFRDRILAIDEGNHEARLYKDSGHRVMRRVAAELGIKDCYSEGAFVLFISFGRSQGRDSRRMIYSVYTRHGSGGGKKPGGKLNKLVDMAEVTDADVFIHSHTHWPMVTKRNFYRCDYRNRKLTEIKQTFVNTNAFLEYGGYGEEQGYSPANRDYPKIYLNGAEREVKVIL